MPIDKFDTNKWNEIKKTEFLRRGGQHWICDFTEAFKKIKEREEYDET